MTFEPDARSLMITFRSEVRSISYSTRHCLAQSCPAVIPVPAMIRCLQLRCLMTNSGACMQPEMLEEYLTDAGFGTVTTYRVRPA
jgi:hypothetical protein